MSLTDVLLLVIIGFLAVSSRRSIYRENLLRLLLAELHHFNILTTTRELYGKTAFSVTEEDLAEAGRHMLPSIETGFDLMSPAALADRTVFRTR